MEDGRANVARSAAGNPQVRRFVGSHLLAVVAEYAVVVATLVDAHQRAGTRATGLASVAILLPGVVGGPVAGLLTATRRAGAVRRAGLAVQALAYAAAGAGAAAGLPVPVVVACVVVGLAAVCTLRPAGAALLPAVVRSSGELTVGNLWVSYCESASALLGPLLAGVLLAVGSPAWALGGAAVAVLAATVLSTIRATDGPAPVARAAPGRGADDGHRRGRSVPVGRAVAAVLRSEPATRGVLGVVLARYVALGALDVALVVLALDEMGLAGSGAGLLNALVGVGAVVAAGVVTVVARRGRLAPGLLAGLAVAVGGCLVLGGRPLLAVALVALPALGTGVTVIDGLGRMLLQRSVDPRHLGPLFAVLETVAGLGMVAGSVLAQVLIGIGGADLALVGLAVVLVALLAGAGPAARRADRRADVPVVEMSLLRALPMFAPLGPVALEALARSAREVEVADGEVVMVQGEPGDAFYAVVDGALDVVMSGAPVRTATRGSFVGEVALLADVPRTATVTARGRTDLLAIDRVDFLVAVTGSDTSHAAAWGVVRALQLDAEVEAPSGLAPGAV